MLIKINLFLFLTGLKSVYAKVGKLLLSDDETFLIFKEETDRYSMEKQKCFRVKGMIILTTYSNNAILI